MTNDLCNLNVLVKLMGLHCQILFNLATATNAETILIQISAEQVSSLHRVAPKYFKFVTSSKLWPLILISALMLFVLLIMILLLSVLTSLRDALALSMSMLVKS